MGVRSFVKNVKGSPLWKRVTAGALVLLMLVTLIPAGLSLARADGDSRSDLGNYISDAGLSGTGVTDDGVTWTVVKKGVTYKLTLSFTELPDKQFFDDNSTMRYYFPTGVIGTEESGTNNITITTATNSFTLHDNPYSVTRDYIEFNFNSDDTLNFEELTKTENTTFYFEFYVTFDGSNGSDPIDFGNGITRYVPVDSSHDASVEKSVYYDSNDNKMHYTVTVRSDGISENVTLQDTIGTGSGVSIDTDSFVVSVSPSGAADPSSVTFSNKTTTGFNANIGSMTDGETITIQYTASLDTSQIGANGKFSKDLTENKAKIQATDDDESNNEVTIKTWDDTTLSTIEKSGEASKVGDKTLVNWTVKVNPERIMSLESGETIGDLLDGYQTFDFSGSTPEISYIDENGTTHALPSTWAALGVTSDDVNTFSYTIPTDAAGKNTIIIKYQTVVDTETFITDTNVKNTTTYKEITKTSSTNVPYEGPGFDVRKVADGAGLGYDPDAGTITWRIEVDVPEGGFNNGFRIVDELPTIWDGSKNIIETYDDISGFNIDIDGLDDENEQCNSQVLDAANGKITLNFQYKNPGGTFVDGLKGPARTITVTLTTPVKQEWLELTKNPSYSYAFNHKNKVVATANGIEKPAEKEVYVKPSGSMEKSGSQLSETYTSTTNANLDYPIYKYEVNLDNLDVTAAQLQDTLPTGFRIMTAADGYAPEILGGNQYSKWAAGTVAVTGSTGTITFDLTMPLSGGNTLDFNTLTYYITLENDDAYKTLMETALAAADNKVVLPNKIKGITPSLSEVEADVDFTVNSDDIVDKKITNLDELSGTNHTAKFKVVINPLGLDLAEGTDTLTLTDTYSKTLSMDFSSVTFDPADAVTQFDASNFVFSATIADETPIVMTYEAQVNGNQKVTFENTVEVGGYFSTVHETENFSSGESSGGYASQVSIRLFKYEDGYMNKPLPGAEFELYEYNDGNPVAVKDKNNKVVTVTTGDDGMALIQGSKGQDGWALSPGKRYCVIETKAPNVNGVQYAKTGIRYQFEISSTGVAEYNNYVFYNNDIMTVKNKPSDTGSVVVTKTLSGIPDEFDLSTVTLKLTVPDNESDTGSVSRSYTLQQIKDYAADPSGAPTNMTFAADDVANTYTWTWDVPYGTAYAKEIVTDLEGYELTKTYRVNGGDYSNYTYVADSSSKDPSVTVEDANPQVIEFKNTYSKIENGKIRVNKTYSRTSNKARTFHFGLFTSSGTGYVRYGSQTVDVSFAGFGYNNHAGDYDNSAMSDDEACFTDLPYGTYYVFEIDESGNRITSDAALEYTISADGSANPYYQEVEVTDGSTKEAVFTNTEKQGSLVISKRVVAAGRNKLENSAYENRVSLTYHFNDGRDADGTKSLYQIRQAYTVDPTNGEFGYEELANGDRIYTWTLNNVSLGDVQLTEGGFSTDPNTFYSWTSTKYTINDDTDKTDYDASERPVVTVTKDGASIAFTNTYTENTGSLRFTKELSSDSDATDETETFVFKISMKDRTDHLLYGRHTFGIRTLDFGDTGVAEVAIASGETQTITDIPIGYSYSVVEKMDASGYPTTKDGTTESYNKHYEYVSAFNNSDVTIVKDTVASTRIINRYSNLASLSVEKKVIRDSEGDTYAIPTADPFDVTITLKDRDDHVIGGTYPITYYKNGETTESEITFEADGTARIQLCKDWKVVISELEVGYHYSVIEADYDYTDGVLAGDDSKYGYKNWNPVDNQTDCNPISTDGTLVNDTTKEVTLTNKYKEKPTAFTITKSVDVPNGWNVNAEDVVPANVYFLIKIQFNGKGGVADATTLPGAGEHGSIYVDNAGKGYVILQDGENASITGIPDSEDYTITEVGMKYDWSPTDPTPGTSLSLEDIYNIITDPASEDKESTWTLADYTGTTTNDLANSTLTGFTRAGDDTTNIAISSDGVNFTTGNSGRTTDSTHPNVTQTAVVSNYYMPSVIYIGKYGPDGATLLPGATMKIYDVSGGTPVAATDYAGHEIVWTTSNIAPTNNPYMIKGLIADGEHEYMLHEEEAPVGYQKFSDVRFTINRDNTINIVSPTEHSYAVIDTNVTADDFLKVTDKKNQLRVQKLANYYNNLANQLLPGATLAIQTTDDLNGTPVTTIDGTELQWTTSDTAPTNNPYTITGLSYGTYYLVEKNVPADYYRADPIRFTFSEDNKVTINGRSLAKEGGVSTITMVDNKRLTIKVSKVDATSEEEVKGAHIQIIDAVTGDVITEWDSADTPKEVEIYSGSYILRETIAPDGYAITTDTRFNLADDGTINYDGIPSYNRTSTKTEGIDTILLVKDAITQVQINKLDMADHSLDGAYLQLREVTENAAGSEGPDANGNYYKTLYINDDGFVLSNGLVTDTYWISSADEPKVIYGLKTNTKYILHELASPDGYKRAEDIFFTLNEYGVIMDATAGDDTPTTPGAVVDNEIVMHDANTGDLVFTKVGLINESCVTAAGKDPDAVRVMKNVEFTASRIRKLNELGEYIDLAVPDVVVTANSNNSGIVRFEQLPIGTYEIQETRTTGNYKTDPTVYYAVVDDSDEVKGLLKDSPNSATEYHRLVNDQYRANIKLVKVSENDHTKKVKGAVYGLYYKNANEELITVATGTTNSRGVVQFNGVLVGRQYVIREISSVDGYYISKDPISVTFKKEGETVVYDTVSFDDGNGTVSAEMNGDTLELTWYEPDVRVRVAKVDINGDPVAGAKLQIRDLEGNVVVDTFKSTDAPIVFSNVLKAGQRYQLVEVSAPKGYMKANPVTFTVDDAAVGYNENKLVKVKMVDKLYPEIYVSKVDATTEEEVAGAHIQILDENGKVVVFDKKKLEWTSDDTSKKVKIAPGTYTLRETVAPDGYTVTTDTKFTVTEDGKIVFTGIPEDERTSTKTEDGHTVLLVEDTMTTVSINKVDVTGDRPIKGAHLRLIDEDGNVVHLDENGKVVEEGGKTEWISSGKEPKQIFGLKTGVEYTLEETVSPDGYTITTKTTFILDKYGKIITSKSTVSIDDEDVILVRDSITSLNFEKYGTYNESCINPPEDPEAVKPLKGVEFTLIRILDEDGNEVEDEKPITVKSNSKGVVYAEKLTKGTYEVRETLALSQYIPDDTVYYAKITDSEFAGLSYDIKGKKLVKKNRLINEIYRTDLTFMKVSESDEAKKLADSTYGLYAVADDGSMTLITTDKTDKNGRITFKGVLINKKYVVRELVSPDGFYVSKDALTIGFKLDNGKIVVDPDYLDTGNGTVRIAEDGSLIWLEPEVIVSFLKQNEDGKALPGAKLEVVDENGTIVVEPWITTTSAYTVSGKLTVGRTYRLIELAAPNGYEVADPVEFVIEDVAVANDENKVITITMTDKKKTPTPTPTPEPTPEPTPTIAPKTGDSTSVQLAILLAMISAFVGLIILDRKLFGRR